VGIAKLHEFIGYPVSSRGTTPPIATIDSILGSVRYIYDFPEQNNEHDIVTPTPSRCIHAAREHSHRRSAGGQGVEK